MTYKCYAGIGSRETPLDIQLMMKKIASSLEDQGYTLRSGGAKGADKAFESGVKVLKEIYLPYPGFNGAKEGICISDKQIIENSQIIAKKFHPKWDSLDKYAKQFHTRNTFQILGPTLNLPVKFVVCWTKDGKASGGTGQAMRIAQSHLIPIYNLYSEIDTQFLIQNENLEI